MSILLLGGHERMEDWGKRMKGYGAKLLEEGLILNEVPDHNGLKQCYDIGELLKKGI